MAQRYWLGLSLAALLTAGGCGSVFTFSDISREQGIKSYDAGDYDAAEARSSTPSARTPVTTAATPTSACSTTASSSTPTPWSTSKPAWKCNN
ncbi:MAG: hypothetical protein QM754_03785 [Tepidisphaeraceae bacterium]